MTPVDTCERPLSVTHAEESTSITISLTGPLKQLTASLNVPSILKVLGLTSWQGVVTVIMLRGSFPCDDDEDDNDLLAFACDTHTDVM